MKTIIQTIFFDKLLDLQINFLKILYLFYPIKISIKWLNSNKGSNILALYFSIFLIQEKRKKKKNRSGKQIIATTYVWKKGEEKKKRKEKIGMDERKSDKGENLHVPWTKKNQQWTISTWIDQQGLTELMIQKLLF